MALRKHPYIPLYVQDFLTDEKLMECSASTTGVYIRLMCVMHKSNEYGSILLKQKDKQSKKQIENFANKIAKYMPYPYEVIFEALNELIDESVLTMDGDSLQQKRMIADNKLSNVRAKVGSKGGKVAQAKTEANSEDEDTNEDVIKSKKKKTKTEQLDLINNDLESYQDKFPGVDVFAEYEKWVDYMLAKGKTYKNYKSAFNNWLRSDFVKRKDTVNEKTIKLICPEHPDKTEIVEKVNPRMIKFCPECRLPMKNESEIALLKIEENT